MELKIKYFGMLSEFTDCNEELLPSFTGTIAELLELLYVKHPSLAHKSFQVAQNNSIVLQEDTVLQGDIALLPPFAGG